MWALQTKNNEYVTLPAVIRGEKLHRFVLADNVGVMEFIGYLKNVSENKESLFKKMTIQKPAEDSKTLNDWKKKIEDLISSINSEWFEQDIKRKYGIDVFDGMPFSVTVTPKCIVLEVRQKLNGTSIVKIGEDLLAQRKTLNTPGRHAQKPVMISKAGKEVQDKPLPSKTIKIAKPFTLPKKHDEFTERALQISHLLKLCKKKVDKTRSV